MAKEMSKKARSMLVHIWADIHKSTSKSPIFSKQLERRYKLSGAEVRSVIHKLRDEGRPICSGADGYYLAKDQWKSSLQGRISRCYSNILHLDHFFKSLPLLP